MSANPTRTLRWRHRATELADRVQRSRAFRVADRFLNRRGPLLSAGVAYRTLFAVFALAWVVAASAGLIVRADPVLTDALVRSVSQVLPGLIDTGAGGVIPLDALLSPGLLGATGAIAFLASIWTALGGLTAAREAVRDIADLAKLPTPNPWGALRDLGIALAVGLALLLSLGLAVVGTVALDGLLDEAGVAWILGIGARIISVAALVVLDSALLLVLYRVLAGVPIPARPLLQGSVVAGACLAILQVFGTALAGLSVSNPLLAGFAALVGLLIWIELAATVVLVGAAWVVVSAEDSGVPLDPLGDAQRRADEARLRARLEAEIREELENELPRAVRWLARRNRRTREGADD